MKAVRRYAPSGPWMVLTALCALVGCLRRDLPVAAQQKGTDSCFRQAWDSLLENRLAEAQRLFGGCTDGGDPARSSRALWLAGLIATLQADFPAATKYFCEAVRLAPRAPEALAAAGRLEDVRGLVPGMGDRLSSLAGQIPLDGDWLAGETSRALAISACREAEQGARGEAVRRMRRLSGGVPAWRRLSFRRGHPLLLFEEAMGGKLPAPESFQPVVYAPCGLLGIDTDGRSGLFVARAAFGLEARPGGGQAPLLLVVEADSPLLLLLDGEVALAHDSNRRALPGVRRLLVELMPGGHEFTLAVAAEGTAQIGVFLLPLGAESIQWQGGSGNPRPAGQGGAAQLTRLPEPGEELLEGAAGGSESDRLLAAQLCWQDGRLDAARSLLGWLVSSHPRSALLRYLLAMALLDDPALPAPVDRARARLHLKQAAEVGEVPLAAFRLALTLDTAEADPLPAIELLRRAERARPDVFLWPLFQGRLLERAGLEQEAWISFRRAFELQPDLAEVQQELFRVAAAGHAAREAQALAQRLELSGRFDTLISFWRGRGDRARAMRLLELEAGRQPGRAAPLLELADVLLEAGDRDRALHLIRQALERERDVRAVLQRAANLLDIAGEAESAGRLWDELVRLQPNRAVYQLMRAVHAGGSRVKIPGEIEADTGRLMAEALGLQAPADAPAVRVLDQVAQQVFPGGESLTRLHVLVRVLTAEGVAKWGELESPPEGAVVEALRTIKADGRMFYAESLPGKETVSLPQLQPGDFVEVKILSGAPAPAIGPSGRGWNSGAWFFASQDEPIMLSRFSLALPAELSWQATRSGGAPEPMVREENDLRLLAWEARGVERLPGESGAPPAEEIFPSVSVSAGMSWEDVRAAWQAEFRLATRPDDGLRSLAFRIGGGPRAGREGLKRLFHWICREVRQRGGFEDFSEPAGHVLARREGNRLVALAALVGALGLEARPLLARPVDAPPPDPCVPQAGIFTQPVLAVGLDGQTLWLTPGRRNQPFGLLDESLLGQPALDLSQAGAGRPFIVLPSGQTGEQGHSIRLQLELDESGALLGQGHEVFDPVPAASFRDALEQLSDSRRRQLLEAGLADSFPGSLLEGSRLLHLSEPDQPLEVTFDFRVPGALLRTGAGLFLPGGLFPYRLSGRYPLGSRRRFPLLVDEPLRISTSVSLRLPPGWRAEPKAPVEWRAPLASFSYRAEQRGDVLYIEKRVSIESGRIPPEKVEEFRLFCHRVGRLEDSPILIKERE